MSDFLFKDRDGQTPLPPELRKGLKIKTIQTVGELDLFEEDNIAKGLIWLEKQKKDPTQYQFWIKLHKKLFEQVWSWAGEIRNHELDNPDFKNPHEIWPELYKLEKDLDTWVALKSYESKEIYARFHERIETIHPFANGNGRFGRIITEQLCKQQNQQVPSWGKAWKDEPKLRRKKYIDSIIEARRERSHKSLVEFMFT